MTHDFWSPIGGLAEALGIAATRLAGTLAPPAAPRASRPLFEARRRTESEKEPLRAICLVCPWGNGSTTAAREDARPTTAICMGGGCSCGVPVETMLGTTASRCPRGRW